MIAGLCQKFKNVEYYQTWDNSDIEILQCRCLATLKKKNRLDTGNPRLSAYNLFRLHIVGESKHFS